MAKYRKRRFYRKRGRWSANIQELGTTDITIPTTVGAWFRDFTLAFNPTQINTAVSQVYTVKNFEVTFEISLGNNAETANYVEDVTAYIMFVPQGMTLTAAYNVEHPEYIMAYRYLGTPINDTGLTSKAQAPKVKTRLSRRLQTGDKVILFLKGNHTNDEPNPEPLEFHGIARWWTKAN